MVDKTLLWVRELRGREFVVTETRLNTIFELLRQMVVGADDDPDRRLAELRRRRAEIDDQIDDEIAKAEPGEVTVLGSDGPPDRQQQFSQTAPGQPDRFFRVADTDLCNRSDFFDFGTELAGRKRRP